MRSSQSARGGAFITTAVLVAVIAYASPTRAAEIRVVSGTGLNAAIADLVAQFEKTSGHKVALGPSAVTPDVAKRVQDGEAMDVTIVNPDFAKQLAASGKVGPGIDFVRFGIGVAVRSGAPKPDISNPDAFKKAVTGAKSITYTRGASGVHFEKLLAGWGILDQVKAKSKQVGGGEAIPAVAKGEVELGIDVTPQIASVPGVDLVGTLPGDLQSYVALTAAITTSAKEPAAARAFVDFLKGPASASIMVAKGMEPIR